MVGYIVAERDKDKSSDVENTIGLIYICKNFITSTMIIHKSGYIYIYIYHKPKSQSSLNEVTNRNTKAKMKQIQQTKS